MEVLVAVVAVVGAITGSLSLYLYWRANRTRIKIEVNPGTADVESGGADPYGNILSKPAPVVFIHLTNKSAHPVKISVLSAVDVDDKQRGFFFPRPYPTYVPVPIPIEARDSVTVWVKRDGLDAKRLRFQVKTTADDSFQTRPLDLDSRPAFELHDLQSR